MQFHAVHVEAFGVIQKIEFSVCWQLTPDKKIIIYVYIDY